MYSSEVVQKLRFFRDARESIKKNPHLSPAGVERQLKNLEQSIELYRQDALYYLKVDWQNARRTYEKVEDLRRQAERLEGERWNYERLNFETASVERRLRAFRDLPEVTKFLETELQSGNSEHVRAVLEVAPGVVRSKFPGIEGEGVARELTRRLNTLLDTPELAKVRQLESEGGAQVLQLVRDTEEVANFFSPGVLSYNGNEFQALLGNVSISRKYTPETPSAFERTTIEFVEPPAEGVPVAEGAGVPA